MSKKEKSIRLSKKHGFQPTMPLCYYCGKEKGTIALLGAKGDKLARELGREDGEMPMRAWIPGDIEPCNDCRSKGIAVAEVTGDRELTGNKWIVDEALLDAIKDKQMREHIRTTRVMLLDTAAVEHLGLHMTKEAADET